MNKKFLPGVIIAAVLCLVYFSCKKSSNSSGNDGRMYFPLQIGKYVTYHVDSTTWYDSCIYRNTSYQMRYTVSDTFTDNMGRPSYLIDIYVQNAQPASAPWQLQSVAYVTPTSTGLEYVQSNVRFIKLIFPVSNNATWPGNNLIQTNDSDNAFYKNWTYSYKNYQQSFNTGYVNFDNTVTVMEDSESTSQHTTYFKETYAYNVGMVYREMLHYTNDTILGCKKGSSVVMRAIDHN